MSRDWLTWATWDSLACFSLASSRSVLWRRSLISRISCSTALLSPSLPPTGADFCCTLTVATVFTGAPELTMPFIWTGSPWRRVRWPIRYSWLTNVLAQIWHCSGNKMELLSFRALHHCALGLLRGMKVAQGKTSGTMNACLPGQCALGVENGWSISLCAVLEKQGFSKKMRRQHENNWWNYGTTTDTNPRSTSLQNHDKEFPVCARGESWFRSSQVWPTAHTHRTSLVPNTLSRVAIWKSRATSCNGGWPTTQLLILVKILDISLICISFNPTKLKGCHLNIARSGMHIAPCSDWDANGSAFQNGPGFLWTENKSSLLRVGAPFPNSLAGWVWTGGAGVRYLVNAAGSRPHEQLIFCNPLLLLADFLLQLAAHGFSLGKGFLGLLCTLSGVTIQQLCITALIRVWFLNCFLALWGSGVNWTVSSCTWIYTLVEFAQHNF